MMLSRSLLLVLLVALARAAPATEEEVTPPPPPAVGTERFANLTSLTLPGASDLNNFTGSSLMQVLVSGGAIILALVGLIAMFAIIAPLFGFKMCYLLGTCNDPAMSSNAYMTGGALANGVAQAYDAYHTYNQPASAYTAASPTYQRRSLQYFGPVLKALNAAYEKYESLASITPVKKE